MTTMRAFRPDPCVESAAMALEIPLDATDEAILRALQEDGRRSYRSVARDVGVSEGTVRARVRKLEQLGALRVVAFVDPARVGTPVLALLELRVESGRRDALIEALCAWPEVTYVSSLIGRADLMLQVMCTDNDALGRIIARVRALDGVTGLEPMLELEVHKFTYAKAGG